MEVVSYYRVSTKGQDKSGLGLEAEREYIKFAAEQHSWVVVAEFEDVGMPSGIYPLAF